MNFTIEQLFNDFNAKYLEEAKARNINLGLQTVFTPIDKIEKATGFRFVDHITAETKSVAVLFNTEFIDYFIKELPQDYINNIKFTFFYDCEFDHVQVQDCIFFSGKNPNIEMISIENIKDLDKVMAGKKFDIVFSNPPYNNIDLKILNSLFKIAKEIIFVHPMGFLFDKKDSKKLYVDIKNTNFLEFVITFWGNSIFKIGSFLPLGITKWNTNKNDDECLYNSKKIKIKDISFHEMKYFDEIQEMKNKIKNYSSIFNKRNLSNEVSEFSIKFAAIRGHSHVSDGWNDDFFSMIALGKENFVDNTFSYPKNLNDNSKLLWSFDNEQSRQNFVKYCKTKFARFCLSFRKVGSHLDRTEICEIPWLDFTQEWNDAKLCKEFGISEELWNYINNFIPDYYEDYKSGF